MRVFKANIHTISAVFDINIGLKIKGFFFFFKLALKTTKDDHKLANDVSSMNIMHVFLNLIHV